MLAKLVARSHEAVEFGRLGFWLRIWLGIWLRIRVGLRVWDGLRVVWIHVGVESIDIDVADDGLAVFAGVCGRWAGALTFPHTVMIPSVIPRRENKSHASLNWSTKGLGVVTAVVE